jgi:hypothetical protein
VADRAHRVAIAFEQLQVEGDVAGAAAEIAPQRRHQERHVQHVDLVGQDLVAETARIDHDRVESERAAD